MKTDTPIRVQPDESGDNITITMPQDTALGLIGSLQVSLHMLGDYSESFTLLAELRDALNGWSATLPAPEDFGQYCEAPD